MTRSSEILLYLVVQPDKFQDQFAPDYGERELRELCTWCGLPFSLTKDAFREYKESKSTVITPDLQKLLFAIDTIPVSTAACERGFSAMNDICTPLRSFLHVHSDCWTTAGSLESHALCEIVVG